MGKVIPMKKQTLDEVYDESMKKLEKAIADMCRFLLPQTIPDVVKFISKVPKEPTEEGYEEIQHSVYELNGKPTLEFKFWKNEDDTYGYSIIRLDEKKGEEEDET